MNKDYKKQILSILVDWYEDSPAYIKNQKPNRRRIMRLYDEGKTDIDFYNIENPAIRKEVNRAVLDLADDRLINFEWMRGQKDHIISGLWLNYDNIDQIYAKLGRKPKSDTIDDVLSQIKILLNEINEEWIRDWLEEIYALISKKRAMGRILPESKKERDDLFKAVHKLSKREETEIQGRIFSVQCFGDSKYFEQAVKERLARIIKKYLVKDDCTDDDALRSAGIVRYPEQFEFTGSLSLILPEGITDFSPLEFGSSLSIEDLKHGQLKPGENIQRIISIENRANYIEYIRKLKNKNELVLYHGGYFSPAKGIFLKAIASSMQKDSVFCHWGDIDYGGFSMLSRLRRDIKPDVQAWKMGIEELKQHEEFALCFSAEYRKKLQALLDMPNLQDCYPCIEYMLEKGIRLEQEAMLINL